MIFLTGGTGLLGSHILKGLRGAGHAVTALVRSEEGAAQVTREGAVAVRGAVEEPETWAVDRPPQPRSSTRPLSSWTTILGDLSPG